MKKLTTMDDYQKEHIKELALIAFPLICLSVFDLFLVTYRMTTIYVTLALLAIRFPINIILIMSGKKQESNARFPYIKLTEYSFPAHLMVSLVKKMQPSEQSSEQMSPKAIEIKQRVTASLYYIAFMLPLFIVLIIAICQMNAMIEVGVITLFKPDAFLYKSMYRFGAMTII